MELNFIHIYLYLTLRHGKQAVKAPENDTTRLIQALSRVLFIFSKYLVVSLNSYQIFFLLYHEINK